MTDKKKNNTEPAKDHHGAAKVTGRYQAIPAEPAKLYRRPTFAAGAVLWRFADAEGTKREVAVIHRPHYNDFSLPKGKVDHDESLPMTALREIQEETGFEVQLGRLLGHVTYPVGTRTKVVYYWTAQVIGGAFASNNEVDSLEWMSPEEAMERVSYDLDREVLAKAIKRWNIKVDGRLVLIRHAHAHPRRTWSGDDSRRPLDKKGLRQIHYLPGTIEGYRPTSIVSAPPNRCVDTASAIAQKLGLPMRIDDRLGDACWNSSMKDSKAAIRELIASGETPVVVSQGVIIPDVLAWLSAEGSLPLEDLETKKSGVWVLSFSEGRLCGADYLASPLPVK